MPIDILQLGRASKQLRSVLFSKSSRHAWIVSRKNVDPQLPDCPTDLSEPKYAYLIFERFCMVSRMTGYASAFTQTFLM